MLALYCGQSQRQHHKCCPTEQEYPFALVADLDIESRCPSEFKWQSYLQSGVLRWNAGRYTVELGERTTLYSHTATKNRSMELSELVTYRHRLFAMCDYTGLIFKARPFMGCLLSPLCLIRVHPRRSSQGIIMYSSAMQLLTVSTCGVHRNLPPHAAMAPVSGDGDEAKPFSTLVGGQSRGDGLTLISTLARNGMGNCQGRRVVGGVSWKRMGRGAFLFV